MLTNAAFALRAEQAFAPFAAAQGVLLAVSGGPDSMALLWLARQHLRARFEVATVDHGLRAPSRDEAAQVAAWCEALGAPHRILPWDGDKPTSRIQERARQARYELLTDHARQNGCDMLMTAHHADDQAETILFRLMRGSGIGGLAGMARVVERGGVQHARPLLDWRKDDLIHVCREAGQAFFDDASNRDPRFARTRMRQIAPLLAEHGLDSIALARLGARMSRADAALDEATAAARIRLCASRDEAEVRIDGGLFRTEPFEIALRVLRLEIAAIGDDPRLQRLERAATALRIALANGESFSTTIGGCLLRARGDSSVTIRREKPRRASRLN